MAKPASILEHMANGQHPSVLERAKAVMAQRVRFALSGLEDYVIFAPILYVITFFVPHGHSNRELVMLIWAATVLISSPIIFLRALFRRSGGDPWRAAAFLACGLLVWPVALILEAFLPPTIEPFIVCPVLFAWGGGAMFLAAWADLSPPSMKRALLLLAGGVIYALIAIGCAADVGFYALPRAATMNGFVATLSVFAGVSAVIGGLLSFKVLVAAWQAYRGATTA